MCGQFEVGARGARAALAQMGIQPEEIFWRGGRSFEATFRNNALAARCAKALKSEGRTADAFPQRFDSDAFVAFQLWF